ncbi:hypothetical protein U1Q18_020758 [Sarracenia purpurea var. burkii]
MGSFVPLGGFFPTPSEFKNLLSSANQSTRCDPCNEKGTQEFSAILKGGSNTTVANQDSSSLPSWLHTAECDTNTSKRVDVVKAKDDGIVLNAKLIGVQRKSNDICQRLHPIRPFDSNISQTGSQIQSVEGFQFVADKKRSSSKDSSSSGSGSSNPISSRPINPQKVSPLKKTTASPLISEDENPHFQPRLLVEEASVTTDLGLGTLYAVSGHETGKHKFEDQNIRLRNFPTSITAEFDDASEIGSNHIASPLDPKDFKTLWRLLAEKVGRQSEALCTVSQTISRCRTGCGRLRGSNHKGDIWLSFLGHDKVAKKRTAMALAEIIFDSMENMISVDLSSEDGMICSNSIFDSKNLNTYYVKLRGKTAVDYIAEELSRKPHSVVLLENVDKTNFLAQTSLSQAIRTGKFPDSHGREIGISNTIFVTTSDSTKDNNNKEVISGKECVEFTEVRILGAKGRQMQVLVRSATKTNGMNVSVILRKESLKPVSVKKRKLIDMNESSELDVTALEGSKRGQKASKSCLDLNLPIEELEDNDYGNCDGDSNSENSAVWLEDFLSQVDEKVVFEPFDFGALAEELLKEIDRSFRKRVGPEVMLQIEEEAMVEILAAAWISDRKRDVEDWVERVLGRGFEEAQQRYLLTAQSIVKLVACEGIFVEEQAPGVRLPEKIILN